MKIVMLVYMGLYLLTVLVAALYSYLKTRHMNGLRLALTLAACLLLALSLFSYAQSYQPFQMVGFALGFTLISSLFLYNGVVDKDSKFTLVFTFSLIRLLIHIQLLAFLYFFR